MKYSCAHCKHILNMKSIVRYPRSEFNLRIIFHLPVSTLLTSGAQIYWTIKYNIPTLLLLLLDQIRKCN